MISVREAIDSGSTIKMWAAIKQRESAREAKQLVVESLRKSDWRPSIRRLQLQIKELQTQLETIQHRQDILPDTLQSMLDKCDHWTKEIALLRAQMPKDAAGKVAKQIESLQLSPEQQRQLMAEIKRLCQ